MAEEPVRDRGGFMGVMRLAVDAPLNAVRGEMPIQGCWPEHLN